MAGQRVAFHGEAGAYSEMAAFEALGPTIDTVPCRTFDAVFASVEDGRADLGLVPVENSLAGSIHRNYDLLLRHDLHIVGEAQLRVEHCLIANPGALIGEITLVRSHPQALAQCEGTLNRMGVAVEASYDTAGSVRELKESGSRSGAAIASRHAADVHDMVILRESLEDNPQNYTRFLLLAREPVQPAGECKTSIVFALENRPGGLFRALACFALRDIDLTKIESRPFPGFQWRYRFYLDFIGKEGEPPGSLALAHLAEMTAELRVLGTYPRGVWANAPDSV